MFIGEKWTFIIACTSSKTALAKIVDGKYVDDGYWSLSTLQTGERFMLLKSKKHYHQF